MARKSNKEILAMPIEESVEYAKKHPAEALRISKILAKSSAETALIGGKYNLSYPINEFVIKGMIVQQ